MSATKQPPTMSGISYMGEIFVKESDCRANVNFVLAANRDKQQRIEQLERELATERAARAAAEKDAARYRYLKKMRPREFNETSDRTIDQALTPPGSQP